MATTFSTTPNDWQGVDDEPTANSENLVKSGGVAEHFISTVKDELIEINQYTKDLYSVKVNGKFGTNAGYQHAVIPVKEGERYVIEDGGGTYVGCYALCTSNTCSSGGDIPLVTGYSVVSIYSGHSVLIDIPNGCNYLIFSVDSSLTSYYDISIYRVYNKTEKDNNTFVLIGNGDNIVTSKKLNNVKVGNTYRLWIKNPDVSMDDVTETGSTKVRFGVSGYDNADNSSSIFYVGCNTIIDPSTPTPLADYYDFTVPQGTNYIKLRARCASNSELVCWIEDITIDVNQNEKNVKFYPDNILLNTANVRFMPSSATVGETITVSIANNAAACNGMILYCPKGTQLCGNFNSSDNKRRPIFITDRSNVLKYVTDNNSNFNGTLVLDDDSIVYINSASPSSPKYKDGQYLYSNTMINSYNMYWLANPYGLELSGKVVGVSTYVKRTYDNSSHSCRSVGTLVYANEIIRYSRIKGNSDNRPALAIIDKRTSKLLYIDIQYSASDNILFYRVPFDGYLISNASSIASNPNPMLEIIGVDYAEAKERERIIINEGNPLLNGDNSDYRIADYIDNDLRTMIESMFDTRHAPAESNVSLIHFSDLHGNADGIAALLEFKSLYDDKIDGIINTGDTIRNYFDDGTYDAVSDVSGYGTIFKAIGNHDGASYDGDLDWLGIAKTNVYNRYIKPYVNDWGVTQPDNAEANGYCWYYKDYSAPNSIYSSNPQDEGAIAGIRLIVLDCMYSYSDLTAQTSWLSSVLSDAKYNKYAVVIAQHCRPAGTIQKINGFDTGLNPSEFYPNLPAVNAVDTFIESGGEFVCWLGGHSHFDASQILTDHNNQLSLIISTNGGKDRPCDYKKQTHHESINLFNLISFNTQSKIVKVLRIGAHISEKMQDNRSFSIKWETKEVWR